MPVARPQRTHAPEQLRGFTGVNLRRDRLSLADEELARCINADLHSQPGTILLRKGRSRQFETPLSEHALRRLHINGTRRYQVAGRTLYRAQSSIATNLATSLLTTLVNSRPLNDTTTWVFVADQSAMRKDNGSALRNWGITGPAAAPTLGTTGTGLTGDYTAVYTYARVVGGTVIHESNPSPAPSAQTLSNENLSVLVTASSDPQVTHIRVYRTVADGSVHLFDQQVTNATATLTSSQADAALGTAVDDDNDVPPEAAWAVEHQGHVFLCGDPDFPHYLYFSKRFRPEAFPSDQFLEIGNPSDPLQCAACLAGQLGVFSRLTKYRVLGNSVSGFAPLEAPSSRGTPAPQACLATELGILFVARDGLFVTNLLQPDTEISQAIEPLFTGDTVNDYAPIDWQRAGELSLEVWKGRVYFAYPTTDGETMLAVYSRDTQQWYFYDHPARVLYVEEEADQLTAGCGDGLVYILEQGSSDAGDPITLTVELADRGSPLSRRRFDWQRHDVEARAGSVTAQLLIDGQVLATQLVTGSRDKRLRRLPGRLGYHWRQRYSYSGTEAVAIYGTAVAALPLEGIG